jgi:Stress responsive A/B Barrel Domain
MICHTVLWQLKSPQDAEAFRAELLTCRGLVPGLRRYDVGLRSDELAGNVDVALVAWFDDVRALNDYLQHPQHQAVSQRIAPLRSQRHVLDFEISA